MAVAVAPGGPEGRTKGQHANIFKTIRETYRMGLWDVLGGQLCEQL